MTRGLRVAGKYELVAKLGSGGMGTVWSAVHLSLGYAAAVKFLDLGGEISSELRGRFDREARVSARLGQESRHVVRVTDHGVLDDGTPYLVMELLVGESLATLLKRTTPGLDFAVDVVTQLARALRLAHGIGVVHRDIKPGNVFLCRTEDDGQLVKLLDFGIAKIRSGDDDTSAMTREGQLVGTPAYMSPEQMAGALDLDARSDLWSVAALTYRIVVGRSPFAGGSEAEVGARILALEPAPPSAVRPGLPAAFDAWMKRGLAKDRERRFQTIDELASSLAAVEDGTYDEPRAPATSDRTPEERTGADPATLGGPEPPERRTRRRPIVWWVGGAVLASAAAGSVAIARERATSTPRERVESTPSSVASVTAETTATATPEPALSPAPPPAVASVPSAVAEPLPKPVARPSRPTTPRAKPPGDWRDPSVLE